MEVQPRIVEPARTECSQPFMASGDRRAELDLLDAKGRQPLFAGLQLGRAADAVAIEPRGPPDGRDLGEFALSGATARWNSITSRFNS